MRLYPVVDEGTCTACGTCAEVCPAEPNVFEVTNVSRVIHPEVCQVSQKPRGNGDILVP
ncbi:4Fe-4S binding protein [Candidatus Desulforudis audaxviator]|uniref:4Fe-4S binding protein n=1 Tax=Candidatus Desulforudis audaxviator TaxID=471827 RepID=UPI002A4E2E58|nr:4Fe-4S binding protein [Candidatus Desulforudis audaxviator]